MTPDRASALHLRSWAATFRTRATDCYPEDIWPPARPGEPHRTPDSAAAAMARHVLRQVADDLDQAADELTGRDLGEVA